MGRLLSSFVAGVFCVLPALTVAAQQSDRARTEALSRRAGERMQALQREADKLASEERTLLGDLRKLEIDRQIKARGTAADCRTDRTGRRRVGRECDANA